MGTVRGTDTETRGARIEMDNYAFSKERSLKTRTFLADAKSALLSTVYITILSHERKPGVLLPAYYPRKRT